MRVLLVPALLGLLLAGGLAATGSARAQDNPLIGTWTATDPATGQQEDFVITAETLQFGKGEPQIPYTAEGPGENGGNTVTLHVGGPGNPAATFTFLGDGKAELALPGGPTVALARAGAGSVPPQAAAIPDDTAPPSGGEDAATGDLPADRSIVDELSKVLVPYGVATRYEPLNQSVEALLSGGWKLDQAAGAGGAFTLHLTKGSANALCILVPKNLGQSDTALSDCRRLN